MSEHIVRGLIGEDDFTSLLIALPDLFFLNTPPYIRDAFWRAVLAQINSGVTEVEQLIIFTRGWLKIYQRIITMVHEAKEKLI